MTNRMNYPRELSVDELLSQAGGRVQYLRSRVPKKFGPENPNRRMLNVIESGLSKARYHKRKFEQAKAMLIEQGATGFESDAQKREMQKEVKLRMGAYLEACYTVGMVYNMFLNAKEDKEWITQQQIIRDS